MSFANIYNPAYMRATPFGSECRLQSVLDQYKAIRSLPYVVNSLCGFDTQDRHFYAVITIRAPIINIDFIISLSEMYPYRPPEFGFTGGMSPPFVLFDREPENDIFTDEVFKHNASKKLIDYVRLFWNIIDGDFPPPTSQTSCWTLWTRLHPDKRVAKNAFAVGRHRRLGSDSPLALMDVFLIKTILGHI